MRIEKYKKIGINKYKLFLSDSEIILYEDVILKHNILLKNDIDLKDLNIILEENKKYEAINLAFHYLDSKMRTKKEMQIYLERKGYEESLINEVLDYLNNYNYLDELLYIKSYINDSINLKNIGPLRIKENLLALGLEESNIIREIDKIDENILINKVSDYLYKNSKLNSKYSLNMLKLKLLNDLYIKGYPKELVYPLLESLNIDEDKNIKSEFKKAINKYSLKYKGKDLNNKVIAHLQRKGFNYSQIEKLLK